MITISDIAKEAGVSNTTVSNVIHGRTKRVSAKTVDRINEIIQRTGYVPNMSARALVSRTSKVVALISHLDARTSGNFLEDPFHNILIGAIEEKLRNHGYYLMLRTIESPEDLQSFLRNWNLDGLFLTGLFEDEDLFETVSQLKIPVVLSDSYLSDYSNLINIGLDDFEGGYIATKHLIEHGHKDIAFVGPPVREKGVVEQRLLGYKKALKEQNIPYDKKKVYQSEFSLEDTMNVGREIAQRKDITGIFCTADVMAAGVMAGIYQSGKNIPEDYSIVGFDDIRLSNLTQPALTTVHQSASKKGELAANAMINMLEGNAPTINNYTLPVELKSRDSVAFV